MNKYLIDLFKEENTVILPGLGALTVVNRATNELMFMPFLKHNDGTLVKYIARQEEISADQAKDKIDKFIEEINAALDQGSVFEIGEVGYFSRDAAGEIQFSNTKDTGTAGSVAEQPVIEIEQIEETPHKEDFPPVIDTVSETPAAADEAAQGSYTGIGASGEEKEETHPGQEEEQIVSESPAPAEQEIPSEPQKAVSASEEEQWSDDLDLPPVNYQPERPQKPILEKTKKDKKPRRNGTIWVILLALLIFGGASYVGFNYNDLKEKIPFLAADKHEAAADETAGDDPEAAGFEEPADEKEDTFEEIEEEIIEELIVEPEEKKVEEKPLPVTSSGSLRVDKSLPVQVIVGSFGEESNAVRMVEKLKSQGFPAEIIGVYGGLYTVSAASFSSMQEYRANLSQLQSVGAHWVKK